MAHGGNHAHKQKLATLHVNGIVAVWPSDRVSDNLKTPVGHKGGLRVARPDSRPKENFELMLKKAPEDAHPSLLEFPQ